MPPPYLEHGSGERLFSLPIDENHLWQEDALHLVLLDQLIGGGRKAFSGRWELIEHETS